MDSHDVRASKNCESEIASTWTREELKESDMKIKKGICDIRDVQIELTHHNLNDHTSLGYLTMEVPQMQREIKHHHSHAQLEDIRQDHEEYKLNNEFGQNNYDAYEPMMYEIKSCDVKSELSEQDIKQEFEERKITNDFIERNQDLREMLSKVKQEDYKIDVKKIVIVQDMSQEFAEVKKKDTELKQINENHYELISEVKTEMLEQSCQYDCVYCDFKTGIKEVLNNHVSQVHYKCPNCQVKVAGETELTIHLKLEHVNEFYKCEYCCHSSGSIQSFLSHASAKHKSQYSCQTKLYRCTLCDFRSQARSGFWLHFKSEHSNKETNFYKCSECQYENRSIQRLLRHFGTNHEEQPTLLKCWYCNYATQARENFTRHFKHTHDTTPSLYKCLCCHYTTKDQYELKLHFKNMHDDKRELYTCSECDYSTVKRGNLSFHFMIKHDEVSDVHKCLYCSFTTKSKNSLKTHFKYKHDTNAKTHKCPHCSFETKVKTTLNNHFKYKHDDTVQLLKCAHCKYTSKRKGELWRHFKNKHGDVG